MWNFYNRLFTHTLMISPYIEKKSYPAKNIIPITTNLNEVIVTIKIFDRIRNTASFKR